MPRKPASDEAGALTPSYGRHPDEAAAPAKRRPGEGMLAATLALGLAWATSRVLPSVPFPPLSFADRLVRLAPGDFATLFIERLQNDVIRVLTAAALLAFLVIGEALPWVFRRSRSWTRWCGAVFAAALLAAGLADPLSPALVSAAIAGAAAGALYALALRWLSVSAAPTAGNFGVSRRQAIASIATAAAGLFAAGTVVGWIARRMRGPNRNVPIAAPDVPARTPARAPLPPVPGLSPEVTSATEHYVVDIDLVDPVVEADGWTLNVAGAVRRPLKLGFLDLQRDFPLVEQHSVLTCVSNEVGGNLVGNSKWMGPRLRDVLAAAGVAPGAVDVVLGCTDGYTATLPLARAMHPTVLLAIAHNGRPLLQKHGFPCRVRAPEVYGMLNAKWLQDIRLVRTDELGFWSRRGWSDDGIVRTESRIDTRADVNAGRSAWIAGVAWAGLRGIVRVEVSVDGGRSWADARLRRPLSPVAWTQWAHRWTPPRPGLYQVACRATDGSERRQEARRRRPHPSGASGYHRIAIRAN